jgi:hypothetical protein
MLFQDAQRQQFDVVLGGSARSHRSRPAGVATLFKHLRFAGVPIITLAEGKISELHVGPKGTRNARAQPHPAEPLFHLHNLSKFGKLYLFDDADGGHWPSLNATADLLPGQILLAIVLN